MTYGTVHWLRVILHIYRSNQRVRDYAGVRGRVRCVRLAIVCSLMYPTSYHCAQEMDGLIQNRELPTYTRYISFLMVFMFVCLTIVVNSVSFSFALHHPLGHSRTSADRGAHHQRPLAKLSILDHR